MSNTQLSKNTQQEKTTGFDFLGFTIRRDRDGNLLTKPSRTAIKRHRERLSAEMRALRGSNERAVIARLNPIIRGWAADHPGAVAAEVFKDLDSHMWRLTYKWARQTDPKKGARWVIGRYFGKHNKFRNDHWVFGDRDSGAYLVKSSWTQIVRHTQVKEEHPRTIPGAGPLLGQPEATSQTPARRLHAPPAHQAGRALPDLRDHLTPEQPPRVPTRVGTMVAAHRPQSDQGGLPPPSRGAGLTGRRPDTLGAHHVLQRTAQPPARGPATNPHALAARPEPCAPTSCKHGSEEAAGAAMRPPLSHATRHPDGSPATLMATRRRPLTQAELDAGLAYTLPMGFFGDLRTQLAEQTERERALSGEA